MLPDFPFDAGTYCKNVERSLRRHPMAHESADFQARIDRTDRARRLEALFPGKTCGAEDCEIRCGEALETARKLGLEPRTFVRQVISGLIAPEYGCSVVDSTAEILEKMRCRFGFVRPETAVPFDDTEFGLESASIKIYTFDSHNEKCSKCEPLENTRVTQQQWEDEEEMKRLGFWKQKDGVYRPHPHCKCVWKETTVNFADYEWKKINNDELATYQVVVPVLLRLKLPPQILQEKLAAMTKLDPSEFLMWGKNIVCKRDKDAFTTTFSVNVPNIWICANLLQGISKPRD